MTLTVRWGYTINYTNEEESYFEPYQSNHLHIGNNGHGDRVSHLFARPPGAMFLQEVGSEWSKGIDTYARVITHECIHKQAYQETLGNADTDEDGVPDYLEIAVWLNPNRADSNTFWQDNGEYNYPAHKNDTEVFARLWEAVLNGPLEEDWADDGLQYGQSRPNKARRNEPRWLDESTFGPQGQWSWPTLPSL